VKLGTSLTTATSHHATADHTADDLTVGQRVKAHPATDTFMRGNVYGTIGFMSSGPKRSVLVKMDRSGMRIRFAARLRQFVTKATITVQQRAILEAAGQGRGKSRISSCKTAYPCTQRATWSADTEREPMPVAYDAECGENEIKSNGANSRPS
jgi:hypothetical protein